MPEGLQEYMIDMTPLKCEGTPLDIAMLAEFLTSDKAKWITGVDMMCDGGQSLNSIDIEQLS